MSIAKRLGAIAIVFILQATILRAGASRPDWLWAWVYLGISPTTVVISGTIMLRTSPAPIIERGAILDYRPIGLF